MKLWIALSLVFMTALNVKAETNSVDSKKIESVAKQLGAMMDGSWTYQAQPASPLEMIKEFAAKKFDESGEDFNFDSKEAGGADSGAWGFVTLPEAVAWVASSELLNIDGNGDDVPKAVKEKAEALVKSLEGSGVIFGAGPIGAVQCGVTLPALLLIDTQSGMIYSINTEGSGC
jgi:hypothetical protein